MDDFGVLMQRFGLKVSNNPNFRRPLLIGGPVPPHHPHMPRAGSVYECIYINLRAGLNRCRKSCRMRWLNYLKPNIKRGDFAEDEVHLMIRLRKLLGNRWSLIAGRLPGRTSNDVKNYWSARRRRNIDFCSTKNNKPPELTKTTVIRPRPRTFTKILYYSNANATTSKPIELGNSSSSTSPPIDNEIEDWKTLLDEDLLKNFWLEDTSSMSSIGVNSTEKGFEMDFWHFLQDETLHQ